MVLGFKTKLPNGLPCNFENKTKKSLWKYLYGTESDESIIPKLHTIREDKNGRWKAGNIIHFATGVRTKSYNCFLFGTCVSVQEIRIEWTGRVLIISVDGVENYINEDVLIKNDGFDNKQDFLDWFGFQPMKPDLFEGKLIHWTDLKY